MILMFVLSHCFFNCMNLCDFFVLYFHGILPIFHSIFIFISSVTIEYTGSNYTILISWTNTMQAFHEVINCKVS
jgi:hypothetical protein